MRDDRVLVTFVVEDGQLGDAWTCHLCGATGTGGPSGWRNGHGGSADPVRCDGLPDGLPSCVTCGQVLP